MNAGTGVAIAVTFVWLGMVLAISFLEAPLKFRGPGITIPLGLGIGRLVFRALNAVETGLALVIGIALGTGGHTGGTVWVLWVAMVVLLVQLLVVRPRLTRRSDAVLAAAAAGAVDEAPRSRAHYVYVGLEIVKVVALVVGGTALLAAV